MVQLVYIKLKGGNYNDKNKSIKQIILFFERLQKENVILRKLNLECNITLDCNLLTYTTEGDVEFTITANVDPSTSERQIAAFVVDELFNNLGVMLTSSTKKSINEIASFMFSSPIIITTASKTTATNLICKYVTLLEPYFKCSTNGPRIQMSISDQNINIADMYQERLETTTNSIFNILKVLEIFESFDCVLEENETTRNIMDEIKLIYEVGANSYRDKIVIPDIIRPDIRELMYLYIEKNTNMNPNFIAYNDNDKVIIVYNNGSVDEKYCGNLANKDGSPDPDNCARFAWIVLSMINRGCNGNDVMTPYHLINKIEAALIGEAIININASPLFISLIKNIAFNENVMINVVETVDDISHMKKYTLGVRTRCEHSIRSFNPETDFEVEMIKSVLRTINKDDLIKEYTERFRHDRIQRGIYPNGITYSEPLKSIKNTKIGKSLIRILHNRTGIYVSKRCNNIIIKDSNKNSMSFPIYIY